jgi:hypothetical protein
MKVTLKILAVSALMVLPTTAARAEAYIGGSLGAAATDPAIAEDMASSWNAAMGYGPGSDCETLGCYSDQEASNALKVFAGYRVNPYFAVEGFIAYLGTYDSYAEDGFGTFAWASGDIGTLGVAAVGMFPVSSRVSLMGKLGVHSWSSEGDFHVIDTSAGLEGWGTFDDSGTDAMGGVGVHIDIGERAAMRVEFEYFAAETTNTEFGIGLFTVGGMFRF